MQLVAPTGVDLEASERAAATAGEADGRGAALGNDNEVVELGEDELDDTMDDDPDDDDDDSWLDGIDQLDDGMSDLTAYDLKFKAIVDYREPKIGDHVAVWYPEGWFPAVMHKKKRAARYAKSGRYPIWVADDPNELGPGSMGYDHFITALEADYGQYWLLIEGCPLKFDRK